jgi:hypothetical protein
MLAVNLVRGGIADEPKYGQVGVGCGRIRRYHCDLVGLGRC